MVEKSKRKREALLPDRVLLIETRYARRFRLLAHVALYVIVAILLFARNSTYSQDLFRSDIGGLLIWAVILALHVIRVLTGEARDRAIERLLKHKSWSGPAPDSYNRLIDEVGHSDHDFIDAEDEIEAYS